MNQEQKEQAEHIERIEEWNDQLIQEKEELMDLLTAKDDELHNINVELSSKIALLATGELQKKLQEALI